jgi:alginate O-acetyltransferase complex protein AlgI
MKVITRSGSVFGGADGLIYLAKSVPWGWPVFALAAIPGMKSVLRGAYRFVARRRGCTGRVGVCAVRRNEPTVHTSWPGWLPIALVVPTAAVFGRSLPSWAYMCVVALAMYAGCKWLTFWTARLERLEVTPARVRGYLFAWPGMDATEFFSKSAAEKRRAREWLRVIATILFGSGLLWTIARRFADRPLLAGWIGMIGAVCVLHFGLFDLLSLGWRTAGVNAVPLMRGPARSTSLAEFWGVRWNTAFHQLAHQYVFRLLRRFVSAGPAMMLVFLTSGLVHELVISVPARGGYGLPSAYFAAQGAGILFERTPLARRYGLGRGVRGWLFAMCVTVGPVFWLFHPPFVRNVIVPLMKTIGAI